MTEETTIARRGLQLVSDSSNPLSMLNILIVVLLVALVCVGIGSFFS